MDAVRTTISTVATQLTAQEKKGMFVAIATPISAALFALIGYAHAKVESNSRNFYIKSENQNIELFKEKRSLYPAIIQLASEQTRESSNDLNQTLQTIAQQILGNELQIASRDKDMRGYFPGLYRSIKNHVIKFAFVGAILPAAILALYEKGAATPATETLQVISNLGAKALRNKGKSICLIVLLIAAKRFHNNAEEHQNSYLEELSKTAKDFLDQIPGFGKKNSSRTYSERTATEREEKYPATSTPEEDQNWDDEYPNNQQPRKTGWFSSITSGFSRNQPSGLDD